MSAELLKEAPKAPIDVEAEFRRLAEWWNRETAHLSNLNKAYRHPAYREIIALGPPVVPVILRSLREKPDWWLQALRELTQANPVDPKDRGDLARMAAAWIQWGRDRGIN